jgi:hypothetical protein
MFLVFLLQDDVGAYLRFCFLLSRVQTFKPVHVPSAASRATAVWRILDDGLDETH